MTRFQEIISMMNSFSFPVDLDHVTPGKKVVYAVYSFATNNVGADETVYIESYQFTLRVFTPKLDSKLDKEIKDAFALHEITWTRDEPTWIDDAKAFELDYNFGIISGG